jgi:hypothetical protein
MDSCASSISFWRCSRESAMLSKDSQECLSRVVVLNPERSLRLPVLNLSVALCRLFILLIRKLVCAVPGESYGSSVKSNSL